jgi:hypothetical protein
MNQFVINSNYGHIHIGPVYVGWHNDTRPAVNEKDCGDECFGFCIGNFYVGCYSGSGWCAGVLNEYGCLD